MSSKTLRLNSVTFFSVAVLMPFFLPEASSTSEEICAKLRGDPLAWDQESLKVELEAKGTKNKTENKLAILIASNARSS